MCENNQGRGEEYTVYLDERAKLIQSQAEETHKFDKAILTLAAGAFGFSLAFIKEIVPETKDGTFVWLLLSWAGFGLSLVFTLVSFLVSQAACRKQIEIVEKKFFGNEENAVLTNQPARWTLRLNVSSATAFILGVILIVVFVSANILH